MENDYFTFLETPAASAKIRKDRELLVFTFEDHDSIDHEITILGAAITSLELFGLGVAVTRVGGSVVHLSFTRQDDAKAVYALLKHHIFGDMQNVEVQS